MGEGKRPPTATDYMAGAMLANGFVWIWTQALPYLSWVPYGLLAEASYLIYLSGGAVASYLVCKRAASGHLVVGIKVAGVSWLISLVLLLSNVAEPTPGLALALLVCFMMGGIAGAYLALRSRLRSLRVQAGAPEEV